MASATDSFRKWQRSGPNQLLGLGVSLLILVVAASSGIQAKRAKDELATKRAGWQRTADQLGTLQQQFRTPTSTETAALIGESAQMGALGVPDSDRVSLLEYLARLADASQLADVRVNSLIGVDSGFVLPRSIGPTPINRANYSVTVDFTGSFAGLTQFVISLPPSVSVSLLGAKRYQAFTSYHIVLSVYELNTANAG